MADNSKPKTELLDELEALPPEELEELLLEELLDELGPEPATR